MNDLAEQLGNDVMTDLLGIKRKLELGAEFDCYVCKIKFIAPINVNVSKHINKAVVLCTPCMESNDYD